MDLDALLLPVAPDAPAGPDLSYESSRQAIEEAFSVDPEEANWDRAITLIEEEAQATRDVWLAVYLLRAGARAGRLEVVGDGAELLAGLFERFWDRAHPTLEEYGIEGRKGACESLVRIGEFLAPLRRVPLIRHPRLGSFSGADFERFAQGGASEDGYAQFRGAVADTPVAQLAGVIAQLRTIDAAFRRADAVLSDQASALGQTGTNFQPTYDTLATLTDAVAPFAGEAPGETASAPGSAATTEGATAAAASEPVVPGRLNNRADVGRVLDAAIEYYRRAEPTSPVPVALERVKGWIGMDFLEILEDISPGGMTEASGVLRSRADRDGGSSDMM